jgi:hypothetical protein
MAMHLIFRIAVGALSFSSVRADLNVGASSTKMTDGLRLLVDLKGYSQTVDALNCSPLEGTPNAQRWVAWAKRGMPIKGPF